MVLGTSVLVSIKTESFVVVVISVLVSSPCYIYIDMC